MMHNTAIRSSLFAVFACLSVSQLAVADIMHTDVTGASVWFTSISEGSPTGDPLPLYGQPFAVVDELVFTPTAAFSATSTSGGPANQTDGKLHLMIEAKPGAFLDVLNFEEIGLTLLNAPFGGDAFTSVLAFAEIKVLEVNYLGVVASPTTHFYSFAPDSSFLHSADATGPSFATAWTGTLSVALPDDVTKVLVTVDNHLYAATVGVGTGALIDKKGFSISVIPTGQPHDIPEPATALLGLLAVCGLLTRRSA
ncbi:MAG: hypothetical protein SH868_14650 [Bythopirellula sp.]|nr:hypothetical protein [Bythopirellula sp.]